MGMEQCGGDDVVVIFEAVAQLYTALEREMRKAVQSGCTETQLRREILPRYAVNRRDFSLLYRWMRRRERPFREGLRLPRRGAAGSRAAGRVVGSWEGRP
jgi:hypothetical protein